jgi:hypothetical protein
VIMTPISRSAHSVDRAPTFDKGSVGYGLDDAAAGTATCSLHLLHCTEASR